SVACQIKNVLSAKAAEKLVHELNSFLRIGISFLGKQYPEQRKICPLMDDGEDEKIDLQASEHPIGAVHG
ncbi:hypothetical protein C2W62_54035, partial [Candidatus Entotheonella serta]